MYMLNKSKKEKEIHCYFTSCTGKRERQGFHDEDREMFVRRNNNYGVCCSDVMPVSEKNIDRELRRPEGDEIGVGLFVEPLQDGIDHSEEPGLCGLCSE